MTPGNETPTGGNTPPDWRQIRDQRRMEHIQWRIKRGQERAEWRRRHPNARTAFLGLMLLLIGVVFLLNNLGVFYIEDVRKYWPVLLIVAGVAHLFFSHHGARSVVWAGMLTSIGGLLFARNLGYIHGDVWEFVWPVVLIFIGILFLFKARSGTPPFAGHPHWAAAPSNRDPNLLDDVAVFGGIQRRVESQEFLGGEISAIFGGIELDLRAANTKKDEIVIETNAVFGGIDLMVPDRWKVTVQGAGVFGGYEDKTHPSANPAEKRPHLTITGSAVFGGVTVRN